jgi:hypothetical protein
MSAIVLKPKHLTCVLSQCASMRQSLKQTIIESKFKHIESALRHMDSNLESIVPIGVGPSPLFLNPHAPLFSFQI